MECHDFLAEQRLRRLRLTRKTGFRNSVRGNEMNPNKTKDFDLRQADSVIYQRSHAGTNSQQLIANVQDAHIPAAYAGQRFGPGQDS